MNRESLRKRLREYREGALSESGLLSFLESFPYEDLGEVKLDIHRELRRGFPEIIYSPGKSAAQLRAIAEALKDRPGAVLFSRILPDQVRLLREIMENLEYSEIARGAYRKGEPAEKRGELLVITAGSSDVPVAEEAALTASLMEWEVARLYDVGVAGIHRLLDNLPLLRRASALVVVAGMDGALPSVVSGLVMAPVVAIPTSTGYGASFGGLSALLAMLNSCSPGITVVNIDNGVGGGYAGALIARGASGKSA
ncbi:MAG TPA: nickel pincer cofactor biosynthesis protein LarB [Synergistaceae bacterium]|nr:nickel pincer cofactor biosynthesis protein LarB [Synergistaceae bacterium]